MNESARQQLELFDATAEPYDGAGNAPFRPQPGGAGVRHIHLGAQIVAYRLRQGQRRRRLSLTIDEHGLRVGAPGRITLGEIENFIRANDKWVLGKLAEYAEYARSQGRHLLAIHDGLSLPLLDGDIRLRVVTGNNRIRWQDNELWLELRAGTDPAMLARRALQHRALALYTERLAHYAVRLGRAPSRLGLSNARTRWGSCSSRTGIRIHWRLIHLPLRLIDYVIVHELSHLVEMNHSPRFWAVVASLLPDWQAARQELRQRGAGLPVW